MAKTRVINTRFWVDDYIANLDPTEKLLFLYFLTNPSTDICGIYEIPLKNIATDTGIEKEMVEKILKRFKRDGKIFYKNGWVGIKNFIKHQSINPKVDAGIKNGLTKAPNDILEMLDIAYTKPMDSLSHLNSNSNSNSNPNSNFKSNTENPTPQERILTPSQKAKNFFYTVLQGEKEFIEFCSLASEKHGIAFETLAREMKKFTNYWTELDSTGKRQRWQKQETFEVDKRFNTWLQKAGQFTKQSKQII